MHAPLSPRAAPSRHIVVLLRRPPAHPRTAQGLRATVGYVLADLRITLVLCGPAAALLSEQPRTPELVPLLRHLSTLRALGHLVISDADADVCELLARADAAVSW
jgi:hypothetical protein